MDADNDLKRALQEIAIDPMGERDRQALGRAYALAHGVPLREPLTADDVAFLLVVQANATHEAIRTLDRRITEVGIAQQEILAELRALRAAPDGYAITLHDIGALVTNGERATSNSIRTLQAAIGQLAREPAARPSETAPETGRAQFTKTNKPDR